MALTLRRKLSQSGRSLVIRIPRDIERTLKLSEDTEVDIWLENGRIIVKPLKTS